MSRRATRAKSRAATATATAGDGKARATAADVVVDEDDEDEPRLRVLLATDDERTRTMSASLLGELGVECVIAKSANEVLEALKRARTRRARTRAPGAAEGVETGTGTNEQVDMILLDVLMPECDGEVELAEACRENEALRGVPIVVMSTVDERKERGGRYEEAGAARFLNKPVNRVELKESLATIPRAGLKSRESGSDEGEGSGNDANKNDGSAKSSLTKLSGAGKATPRGSEERQKTDSGSDNLCKEKRRTADTRRAEAAAIDRWASHEGGSGDCGSGGSADRTGSGSGSHEGSGSGQRDPNESDKFRGLSVQLIKAHGGATTMLELSLPTQTSEQIVVRRSNSRSAFQGFQNYLKNESKDTQVHMMSAALTPQQHQLFFEASSMMPPADFMNFYGPILPQMPPHVMDVPPGMVPVPQYFDTNPYQAPVVPPPPPPPMMMSMAMDASVTDQSFMSNPFYSVLQTTADHVQQTCTSAAAEHRAAAIRRFLKKRKERNFEKKVRYASRQKLAESRLRVRGQFIRADDTTATTTENGSNGSEEKKSNESNVAEGNEMEYGSNIGASNEGSNEGSKEGSRSSS